MLNPYSKTANQAYAIEFHHFTFLYGLTLLLILAGWATNCLPLALPSRFAFVVAAYSAGVNAFIAFSGKYRSPVSDDFLPDLVRHFWSPQDFSDFWLFANALTYIRHQTLCTS